MPTLDDVLAHLDRDANNALERLKAFLSIPSVSTDPAFAGHVRRAAEWVANDLRECGLEAEVRPTAGHPVVLGKTKPDAAPPGAPRVLFYGHYDVQPPDPLNLWKTPPFEPDIRDGKIYARGAVDDKGQVATFLEALRAWNTVNDGKFPVHVTVLIEGEEENGSANLRPFLQANATDLSANFVLISDTGMWETPQGAIPAITYALRGLQYFDIKLHGPNRDLHSGVYGGIVPNPINVLTQVLGRLFDKKGRIAIPGFYDDVAKLTPAEKRQWKKLGFDETPFMRDIGLEKGYGESGFSTLERRWGRPSCDINGIYGGYQGPGAKTVIPSFAGAKVSFRLAANQSAAKVSQQFRGWLESQDLHGCRWEITDLHGADPVITPTESPWIAAASRGLKRTSGKQPMLVREGATIPVCIEFKRVLNLDCVLVGFGLSDDCIHSPNEKFNLDCYELGKRSHAAILAELATAPSAE